MRGKFITIEGCEGVGKSTQIRLIREKLEQLGIEAVFTREPGGTRIGESIREVILNPDFTETDPLTELLLYTAARRQHTAQLIEKSLEQGKLVFCDRFIDSTLAYQGYGRNLDKQLIKRLNAVALGDVNIDLTIFMDVDPEAGFRRKGGADKSDRLENEQLDFHKKVYEGFRQIAAENPDRIVAVKAEGTKFETHEKIMALLQTRLNLTF